MDSQFISHDHARKKSPESGDPDLDEEDLWVVVGAFLETNGLVQHQLASYDEFIENGIHSILGNHRIMTVEVRADKEEKKLRELLGVNANIIALLKNPPPKKEKFEEEWSSYVKFMTKFGELISKRDKFMEENHVYMKVGVLMKKFTVEFGELVFKMPSHGEVNGMSRKITPFECKSRDITYQSQIFIDITTTDFNGHVNIYHKIPLGSIPVMVGSKLCNLRPILHDKEQLALLKEDFYDPLGYFIIKGAKKVIASQERTAHNQAYVFKNRKRNPKYVFFTESRSCAVGGSHSTTIQVGVLKDNLISVTVPYIDSTAIPLGVMFRALGVKGDCSEMANYILSGVNDIESLQILTRTFEYSLGCKDEDQALHFIGKKGKKFTRPRKSREEPKDKLNVRKNAISYAKHLLSVEFLPHLGTGESSMVKKRFYLGYMVQKLLSVLLGRSNIQDRDHFANKRIATAGILLCQQFDNAFRRLRNEIANAIERAIQKGSSSIKVISHINVKTITNALNGALSDNSWGVRGKNQGVSQKFDQFNFMDSLSNLRKLVTPISQEGGKIDAPRKLHSSQWGAVCIAETPEGKKVGLVKNLALGALISVGSSSSPVMEILKTMNIITFEEVVKSDGKLLNLVKIFINGDPIGVTRHPDEFVKSLRLLRRRGGLNPEISISFDTRQREIRVMTEAGRICRPLFVVEKGRVLLRKSHIKEITDGEWDEPSVWSNLFEGGFIELIDKAEEENLLVAFSPQDLAGMKPDTRLKYTHCELHTCLIFGIGASSIPFPHLNQSPRNTYQASMGKQAIGIPGINFTFRTRGKFHAIWYPQKSLVQSRAARMIGFDDMPTGQNAMVAVCPWQGFGQEDSIILNQDSIDRGFMVITTYLCFEAKVDRRRQQEQFEIPVEEQCNLFKGNIGKLIIKKVKVPGSSEKIYCYTPEKTKVSQGDVLIGKTSTEDEMSVHRKKKTDGSVVYDHPWAGTVHLVQYGIDGNGYDYIRVVIAQRRPPVFGDKFSARHGQKGTVGMIYRSIDLPFDRDGIAPDIIVNPLAFPSRMTIGMLVEMITGKKVVIGSRLNTTPVKKVFCLDSDSEGGRAQTTEPESQPFTVEYSDEKFKDNGDATPFNPHFSLTKICAELKSLGFDGFGDEQMINGMTGEPIKTLIYTGPCKYERLKHMVIGKVHARSRGGRNILTRQPKEGRKFGGGFRIGHMERDCFLAQGLPSFARDRLMDQSDGYHIHVCKHCGIWGTVVNMGRDKPPDMFCNLCDSKDLVLIRLPYATKLLSQELAGMNIIPRVLF